MTYTDDTCNNCGESTDTCHCGFTASAIQAMIDADTRTVQAAADADMAPERRILHHEG